MWVIGVDFRFGLLLWFLFQVCAIGLQFGFLVRVSGLGLWDALRALWLSGYEHVWGWVGCDGLRLIVGESVHGRLD